MKILISIGVLCFCLHQIEAQDSLTNTRKDTLPSASVPYYYKKAEKGKNKIHLNLTPGINLFLLAGRGTSIDFSPYVSKQIAKHWIVGLGWNQRISFRRSRSGGGYTPQLFGPRIYISYLLPHGFSLRLIPELMDVRLPRNSYTPGHSRYSWEWSAFSGVRKDFKIGEKATAYAELLYDVATTARQNLYGDVVNLRIGIEINRLKKNKSGL